MKDHRLLRLQKLDRLILQCKGFPELQDGLWRERTTLFYAIKQQYGVFPKWVALSGYVVEEKFTHEDCGGAA